MNEMTCSICGGQRFVSGRVLWPELIAQWQLSAEEVDYVDRQQGTSCAACGANLRLIALAIAIRNVVGTNLTLREAIACGLFERLRILDCNEVGVISSEFAQLSGYTRADFPEHDMRNLSFDTGTFDLVVHSDTLEHVDNPVLALEECRRVLKPGGHLCFTVPIIVGRLSRNRAGLSPSYHGDPTTERSDFVVHTEFGSDAWTKLFEAGFANVALTSVDYPAALALTAWDAAPADRARPAAADRPSNPEEAVPAIGRATYDQDGLRSIHNHDFMRDPVFQAAYDRGVRAAGADYQWHWRVHIGLWAASQAANLPGDFAEFGVNRGFLSSAIMQLLDWNSTGRRFYLLDTFAGIDERYVSAEDLAIGVMERNERELKSGFYTSSVDDVRANFAEWSNVRIIAGPVPETLALVDSNYFAFAHIDMNCAPPEVAAADYLWSRIVPGGIILLDDYAYAGYESQKLAMDSFAASKGVSVLSLPTGQGLIIRPPA
jgi:SAM-dependent methyltransferase